MVDRVQDLDLQLAKFAELILRRGVNIKPGQLLMISAPIEGASFVRTIMAKAFELGARDVMVRWGDQRGGEIRLRHASVEVLGDVPKWLADSYNDYASDDVVFLALDAEFPPPTGIDPEKMIVSRRARIKATEPFSQARMKNIVRWNIASVATVEWAHMIYPDLSDADALDQMWHDVLYCTRALGEDPIADWDAHVQRNNAYRDKLNAARFTELHFTSDLGTDLLIGMPEGYLFSGSQEEAPTGEPFIANMPSEEIFSAPHRDKVNGTVVSSKPLFYNNVLVEGLRFTFKDGEVVDYHADHGTEVIEGLLTTDEGAKRLGEVALVPHDSAISQTGKLFYSVLYDENAACHLALGESYPMALEGGLQMSKDELLAHGMNQSLEHVDFMFGCESLDIVGTNAAGEKIQVFKSGTWAL